MSATVKIRKIGNSYGVLLSKDVLDDLQVSEGDTLRLSRTENGMELTPSDDDVEALMALAEEIMDERRTLLKALAK